MPEYVWYAVAAAGGALLCVTVLTLLRASSARRAVLRQVAHMLRGGTLDRVPGHGERARGQLGQLEITVELHRDPHRRSQSPMWRVLAVGPVQVDAPVEAAVEGWRSAIDPWLDRLTPVRVTSPAGTLAVRTEGPLPADHPVLAALHAQNGALAPGALYARNDLMRAEVQVGRDVDARGLFAYLTAMRDISEMPARLRRENGPRAPRTGRVHVVRASDNTRAAG